MMLLVDIGNTHTHLGLGGARGVRKKSEIKTASWRNASSRTALTTFVGRALIDSIALCSVVPEATALALPSLRRMFGSEPMVLSWQTVLSAGEKSVGIDYPKPASIGADRLANAIAVRQIYGFPSIVVDFGTAVTFDVVDRKGNYAGGVIAPGQIGRAHV